MTSVVLDGVTKSFGSTQVLQRVDAEIEEGNFAVLVGPSGCGKSTLLRLIAGLETVTSGRIRFGERDVTELAPRERDLAMVFQSYALYPHMTVRENIAFGLELRKIDPGVIAERVAEVAKVLELDKLLDRHPRALSGGQRQRVAMGRAIAKHAKLFLFDEPLSNLDPALRNQVRVDIRRLHDQLGATSVYVTHDQVEAMTLADQLFVLNEGIVQQSGRPLDIYRRPANRFVASFVGSPAMNFLDGVARREGDDLRVEIGSTRLTVPRGAPVKDGREVTVGIRPHDVQVIPEEGAELTALVGLVETLGPDAHVHSTVAGQPFIVCVDGERAVQRGQRLGLSVTDLHLFDPQTGRALRD